MPVRAVERTIPYLARPTNQLQGLRYYHWLGRTNDLDPIPLTRKKMREIDLEAALLRHLKKEPNQDLIIEPPAPGPFAFLINEKNYETLPETFLLYKRSEPFSPGWNIDGIYQIIEEITAGGMGTVYKTFDSICRRYIALKRPLFGEFYEAEAETMRILSGISSPHIVRTIEDPDFKTMQLLAFEYIDGVTLSEKIKKEGALSLPKALQIASAVCFGLKAAAGAKDEKGEGILHLDLKPSNIMIKKDGAPVLIDWGLSRYVPMAGMTAGNPWWSSPEQLSGERPRLTIKTDIYSLGLILYRMITGIHPFKTEVYINDEDKTRDIQEARSIKRHKIPPISKYIAESAQLMSNIEKVIGKMTAAEKEKRYQDYDQLIEDLKILQGMIPNSETGAGVSDEMEILVRIVDKTPTRNLRKNK